MKLETLNHIYITWRILTLACTVHHVPLPPPPALPPPSPDKQLTFGMTHSPEMSVKYLTVLFLAVNLISEGISHFILWAIKPTSEE